MCIRDSFYVEPFLERMALLCNHEVEIEVSPKDLLVYADENLLSHVVTNLLKLSLIHILLYQLELLQNYPSFC